MRKPATVRRVPPAPTDDDFFVRFTIDALIGLMTDLRDRVEQSGTRREVAQVLLAEAHVDEAVGLLRTVQPAPSLRESHKLSPDRHAARRVQRVGRRGLQVVF
jgi:hypothetical protein